MIGAVVVPNLKARLFHMQGGGRECPVLCCTCVESREFSGLRCSLCTKYSGSAKMAGSSFRDVTLYSLATLAFSHLTLKKNSYLL